MEYLSETSSVKSCDHRGVRLVKEMLHFQGNPDVYVCDPIFLDLVRIVILAVFG